MKFSVYYNRYTGLAKYHKSCVGVQMDLQRRDVGLGWDHYWISGPSSAIIGAAYMGYMDITFPHGCVWINRLEWKFLR